LNQYILFQTEALKQETRALVAHLHKSFVLHREAFSCRNELVKVTPIRWELPVMFLVVGCPLAGLLE